MRGRRFVGCPKGTPEEPLSLSSKNAAALWHFRQCSAVGSWPDDEIVRQNAGIISSAERLVDTLGRWKLERAIAHLMACSIASIGSTPPVPTSSTSSTSSPTINSTYSPMAPEGLIPLDPRHSPGVMWSDPAPYHVTPTKPRR